MLRILATTALLAISLPACAGDEWLKAIFSGAGPSVVLPEDTGTPGNGWDEDGERERPPIICLFTYCRGDGTEVTQAEYDEMNAGYVPPDPDAETGPDPEWRPYQPYVYGDEIAQGWETRP